MNLHGLKKTKIRSMITINYESAMSKRQLKLKQRKKSLKGFNRKRKTDKQRLLKLR